jgi:hypothetical protein
VAFRVGYRYIEALDPKDGKRYRYTGSMKVVGTKDATAPNIQLRLKRDPNYDLNNYEFRLDRVPAPGSAPRYGVTYDDISTREEREYWIAGSSLKVIDLQTNEVMAERIGYMMDRGQGDTGGGGRLGYSRAPCLPGISEYTGDIHSADQTRNFVTKVPHQTSSKGELT